MTNSGPPAALAGPDGEAALPGELETEVEWFRQSRVTLVPGAESGRLPTGDAGGGRGAVVCAQRIKS